MTPDEYRKANKTCELYWCEWIPRKFRSPNAHQLHHIFSSRMRLDVLSNWLMLSVRAHDFCHHYPREGRILALLVKCRKGELDFGEVKRAGGSYPDGWLDSITSDDPWKRRLVWIDPYVEELREWLAKLRSDL